MGRAARAGAARRHNTVRLVPADAPDFDGFVRANAARCRAVVQAESATGQHLVLCGAGPTLVETVGLVMTGDQVWACNGALPWLIAQRRRVTHGFTVNQTAAMLDVWADAPAVDYLLASSVDPRLATRLAERRITWFHNAVGCSRLDVDRLDALYATLFPPTLCAGAGLNAITRALDVADYMGFATITILGADCALRGKRIHVDGSGVGVDQPSYTATIDGRAWTAPIDLWVSANCLARMSIAAEGRIHLVGDTLPKALLNKPIEYLDRLPHMVNERGERLALM